MKTIGIKLADGSFFPVMEDNHPAEKALELTTAHNNQTKVMVDLYRSKTCSMDDAEYVDSLQIDDLVSHPNGEPSIAFSVAIDENSQLSANIHDPETGHKSEKKAIPLITRTKEELKVPDEYDISDITPPSPSTEEEKPKRRGLLSAAQHLVENEQKNKDESENNTENKEDNTEKNDEQPIFNDDTLPDPDENSIESIADSLSEIPEDDMFNTSNFMADDTNDNLGFSDFEEENSDGSKKDPLDDFFVGSADTDEFANDIRDDNEGIEDIDDIEDVETIDDDNVLSDNFDDIPEITEELPEEELNNPANGIIDSIDDIPDFFPTDETVVEEPSSDEPIISDDDFGDLPDFDDIDDNNGIVSDDTITEEPSSDEPIVSDDDFGDLPDFDNIDDNNGIVSDDTIAEEPSSDEPIVSDDDFGDLPDFDDIDDNNGIVSDDTIAEEPSDNEDSKTRMVLDDKGFATSFDNEDDELDNKEETKALNDAISDNSDDDFSELQTNDSLIDDLPDFSEFDSSENEMSDEEFFSDNNNSDKTITEDKDLGLPEGESFGSDFDDFDNSSDDDIYSLPDFPEDDSAPELPADFFNNIDEPSDNLGISDDQKTSGDPLTFTGLYDKETEMGMSGNDYTKKTKTPVVICVICALICLAATAFVLFTKRAKTDIPEQTNGVTVPLDNNNKDQDEKKKTIEKIEEKKEIEVKDEVPPAKEDEIVIVEEAEKVIPVQPPVVEEELNDISYNVTWGDTLWDIANTYYKDPWKYTDIAKYNNIKNPDHIVSGTEIIIPAE